MCQVLLVGLWLEYTWSTGRWCNNLIFVSATRSIPPMPQQLTRLLQPTLELGFIPWDKEVFSIGISAASTSWNDDTFGWLTWEHQTKDLLQQMLTIKAKKNKRTQDQLKFCFGLSFVHSGSFLAPTRVQPRLYSFQGDVTSSAQGFPCTVSSKAKQTFP